MKHYLCITFIFSAVLTTSTVNLYALSQCGDANHPYPDGDYNEDCYVNMQDYAILAESWLTCSECGASETYPAASAGCTLYTRMGYKTTYLIDIDKSTVHTWQSNYNACSSVYLLGDTALLRAAQATVGYTRFNTTGGRGGRVELFDWDGNLLWSYQHASNNYMLHHDIEMLPNGNVLMVAWEYKTRDQAIAAGRNPSLVTTAGLWPDKVIEVEPNGTSGGNIVWEWHVWDHLIQDYDATKADFGVVGDHPELINLNFKHDLGGSSTADWLHTNAVDYNPQFDQILLTPRKFSEVWVIDHSTTTAEAASHSGGSSGKGGDLLYRWGNPQTYDRGTSADQQFFVPHDGRWIEPGLPGEGDILIFNNGQGRPGGNYSSVDQITPPIQGDGSYYLASGLAYGPADFNWSYTDNPVTDFYAANISGAHRLPNGNTLICNGPTGRFFEVTTAGSVVWEYTVGQQVFRCERYRPSYPGLANMDSYRDFEDLLELTSNWLECTSPDSPCNYMSE
jgi:hypothetical protein